jgi:hypothetical protein
MMDDATRALAAREQPGGRADAPAAAPPQSRGGTIASATDVAPEPKHISLVGKLPLAELPALLAGVSLFVGNNSGPKHIAAGLGVPTVGIHSGTEDVLEWGPVGPRAIAVAREVVCAPCYLAHAADCRRGLACLRELEPARVYDACKRLLLTALPAVGDASRRGNGKARGKDRPGDRPREIFRLKHRDNRRRPFVR